MRVAQVRAHVFGGISNFTKGEVVSPKHPWSRRSFLKIGGSALALGATGCLRRTVGPAATVLGKLNAWRRGGIDLHLRKERRRVGDRVGEVITFNGSFPGPVIRMREGRDVEIRVHNHMDESTSIHWHGILVPFDMDGVPGISFRGIDPHSTFTYRYRLRQNGTYWYHSHSGFQEQLGHYGQLIVEPNVPDPVDYDIEHSIVLSDWTSEDPDAIFARLKKIEGYYNFQRPVLANLRDQVCNTDKGYGGAIAERLRWDWMRMDPTDLLDVTGVTYSHLINGHTAAENPFFAAQPGQRVRLRFTNASAMTIFDVRIPGLPMTVVQADGQNVEPVETDEFRISVAETYDVIVTLPDARPYTLFAETMDRSSHARGTLGPAPGGSAAIPDRRPRPMLTMADMGMMQGMDGHGGHAQSSSAPSGERPPGSPAAAMASTEHSVEVLPTSHLVDRVEHGSDMHGPGSITMAKSAYRQLDDPGVGLGNDGWRVLTYGQLRILNTPDDRRPPTREIDLHLTGNMHRYVWGFNGKKWSESKMLRFVYGERLRINFFNDTMMSHPIHLHGMWMDLYAGNDYSKNPRKHTVNVQPAELLTVDVTVDAPGQWAFHCHLLYHMEAGMFRTVAVVKSLEGEAPDAQG